MGLVCLCLSCDCDVVCKYSKPSFQICQLLNYHGAKGFLLLLFSEVTCVDFPDTLGMCYHCSITISLTISYITPEVTISAQGMSVQLS